MLANAVLEAGISAILALNRSGRPYALCGGLALSVYGEPRATKDVDIVIAGPQDLPAIDAELDRDGWFRTGEPIPFPDGFVLHRRNRVIGREMVVLDLLCAPAGLDLLSDRIRSDFAHAAAYVVSRRSLIHMKRMAGRPQDLADIAKLEAMP